MTEAADELETLERAFWFGDADHYHAKLTPGCLMIFPGMGIATRDQLIEGIGAGPRWAMVVIEDWQRDDPAAGAAVVAYRATATREGLADPYRALCGSLYVRLGGEWRLAFHQQTLENPVG